MNNILPRTSWHFKRYIAEQGISLSLNSLLTINLRGYVSKVVNSLLRTYVFNSGMLITIIFLLISLDKLMSFFADHWLATLIAAVCLIIKEYTFLRVIFYAYTKPADTLVSVHR